jgi:hypothetical protein
MVLVGGIITDTEISFSSQQAAASSDRSFVALAAKKSHDEHHISCALGGSAVNLSILDIDY